MNITYDIPLVILSAIVAVGAGFFTIEMSNEIVLNKGIERWTWLIISAITMGMGIWGMHFIAMTAFSMGVEVSYDFFDRRNFSFGGDNRLCTRSIYYYSTIS